MWQVMSMEPELFLLIYLCYGKTYSITIDGVSLTVAKVDNKSFAVSVIPHTGQNTTLLDKKPGDTVNLENDMVGKYVEKLLQYGSIPAEEEEGTTEKTGITMDFLIQNGF